MDFKTISHKFISSWGGNITLMEENGKAFARIYWYNDDLTTVYLDSLSVNEECRKLGFGTKLQEIREKIGMDLGADKCFLYVNKDTWMFDWYKRRGYEIFKPPHSYKKEKNIVWLMKNLKK